MSDGKVIITAALTGGVHDKRANENLPEQPDEIIEQALACREAGAAIVHCHARTADGGRTCDPEIFREIHAGISSESDVIVQLTTGGGLGLSTEERMGAIWLAPEMASLNMGLMNFIFDGEEHFFSNMRSEIESFAQAMKERRIRPECEVYNISMLDEVEHLIGEGLLDAPYVINLVLHTPTQGGLRGTPENLVELLRRVEARFGLGEAAAVVNVTSCGATQLPITTMAMAIGLNVRVGMEDNVFYRRGELVADNRQLVERAVRIARELDREPATPDEARERLGIRPGDPGGPGPEPMTRKEGQLTETATRKLNDKVAIVTGGSQGIGRAVAEAYAREGARVVIVNVRSPERGEEVARAINAAGGTAVAIAADVTSKAEVDELVSEVVARFGTVDILFHGAGVMINKPIEDYTEEDWDRTIDVNLKGSFLMAQAVVPLMKAKREGKIIFIASIAGSVAFPNAIPYCASKGGVVMITKALAAEVAKEGINVNAISPGNTATPLNQHLQDDPEFVRLLESMTPTGRAYISTEEMAGAAVFLASDEARAVHGHDLVVDDGWAAI